MTSKMGTAGGSLGEMLKLPEYHNPDPLMRLIGKANESSAVVEGVPITCLIDSGSCMSAMAKGFAEELQLEIKSLKTILDIEVTGGGTCPYYGYVECCLQLPQIKKIDVDVLMLIIDDSAYSQRVPVQIGTLHIDMALDLATESELRYLSRKWEQAKMATALRMNSIVVDEKSFKLDEIKGAVHTTQKLTLGPFENATVTGILKGLVKNSSYHKRVNISLEPLDAHREGENNYCAVPGYTFLKPGSDRVKVMIKNLTAQVIKVQQGSKVALIKAANVVPHMLAPREAPPPEPETQVMKSANIEVSQRDLPISAQKNVNEMRCATSMDKDDVGTSGRPIEVAPSKPEVDRTPLSPEQMKTLYEQIKLDEGTASWTEDQRNRVKSVIKKYSFLFAMNSLDLGRMDMVKHHIELNNYTPIKDRYRRIPPHQYEEVRRHLKEMLDIGAIRRSNSPWASPVVLVRKKDRSLRFCVDLRKLNARTVKDAYSLPRIEEALDSLNGACIFTSLDLKSGYWQVELDEDSIPLTAFTVGPLGFYECVRMPFGLTNAPATFQRLMESCLGELHLDWCIIYLDDIIIFSKTPDDHITRLEGVFEKLAKAGLKLKPSKCEFFRSSLKYLGHIVSKDGIATDPRKIEAITKWPQPKTVTDVRSFTGFTNYYRKFIKGYAKIAHPLHELTSGDNAK